MKMWRTLVRVTTRKPDWVAVVLPAWNSRVEDIFLPLSAFPEEVRAKLEPGYRFHAKVNIGEEDRYSLVFDDMEFD